MADGDQPRLSYIIIMSCAGTALSNDTALHINILHYRYASDKAHFISVGAVFKISML